MFNSKATSHTKDCKCLSQVTHASQDRIELLVLIAYENGNLEDIPSMSHVNIMTNATGQHLFEDPKHQKEAGKEIRQWVQIKFHLQHY